jgi:DNA-binding SARP family transcriptional activator/tetratricopeptide (TPR) repeat protein
LTVVDIRVLGPLELRHDGQVVALGRQQCQLILGVLALEANRAVSSDRLIDLLWGQEPPRSARAVLQTRVSELRSILATIPRRRDGIALVTRGSGYVLELLPEAVDAHVFAQAMKKWRAAPTLEEARLHLRSALDLWRGRVLEGIVPRHGEAALCDELEAMRLRVLEDLFTVELKLGNHVEIADQVVRAVAEQPTRERFVAQMLVALYRSGRAAEALSRYDQWRRWLREEFGSDPGRHAQDAYLAVVRGESAAVTDMPMPSPDAEGTGHPSPAQPAHDTFEASTPSVLPPDIFDFTGRDRELAWLTTMLTEPTGSIAVAIVGRGGVGKSALAARAAHALKGHFPHGQLYASLRRADSDRPIMPYDVLGRFLRGLGVDGYAIPQTLEERVDLYRGLLAGRRVLVVLDDVATDDQAMPLLPGNPEARVVVAGRARIGGALGAVVLNLDVMDATRAVDLLGRIAGVDRIAAETDAALELVRQCGHLPLAVRIVGAKLAAKPHWTVRRLLDRFIDERNRLSEMVFGHLDVRASVELSFGELSPRSQLLLRMLGDIDLPEASVWLSSALLGTSLREAEECLEELFDAQLIDVESGAPDGSSLYRMQEIIRLYAREKARGDDSGELLAAARDRAYAACMTMADLAIRAIHGGDSQNIRGDAPRWEFEEAWSAGPLDRPLAWFETFRIAYQKVVVRAASDGRADYAWQIACTISPLFQMQRHFDDWQDMLAVALAATRRAADVRGEAAILFRLGMVMTDRVGYDDALQYLRSSVRLFDLVGDAHGAATSSIFVGLIDRVLGDVESSLAQCEAALPALRAAGDRGGEAFALRTIGQIHLHLGRHEAAAAEFAASLAIYRQSGARQGQAQVIFWQSMMYLDQGLADPAMAGFEVGLAITREIGDRPGEAQCLRGLSRAHVLTGDRERARETLQEALRLVRQPRQTQMELQIRQELDAFDGLPTH